jgi:hypothetical protein
MKTMKIVIAAATLLGFAGAADAWNSDGNGHIRCADCSSATARQQSDGAWTVDAAGAKRKTGGSFPREGKAALWACWE